MIVDSSALIAIIRKEPGYEQLVEILLAEEAIMASPVLVEARVVVTGYLGREGRRALDGLLARFHIEIVPFDEAQADAASDAYRDFGRGSGHAARLNLGDTYSFALAHVRDEPLLYAGDDFTRTGIRSALEELDELA